jgi:cyanophycinase
MILASLLALKAGAFLLVGGGNTTPEMVKKFSDLCGGWGAKIVVLGQTLGDPSSATKSRDFLIKQGFKNVELLQDKEFTLERKRELAASVLNANGIWVPGGDQRLIVERLGAEWGKNLFDKAIKNGTNWFGTSAGAMCVSDPMIRDEVAEPGFGLIDLLIDTHFVKRNREMRLKRAFFSGTASLGIGLDEGEWVVIRNNQIEETKGSPRVLHRE